MAILSQVKYETVYFAIMELHEKSTYPIQQLCEIAGIQRSSYYKWRNRKESAKERVNKDLIPLIIDAYQERDGILGYRQMTIKLNREHNLNVNHKRIYRLMKILHLKSVCRKKRKSYVQSAPEITAENILHREFAANQFGQKWLTDVTEMKYGLERKAYLSAILDLGDKSIVAFVLGHSNNNELVFNTFDMAHKEYPGATPLFHSDRGFQYTSKIFQKKLVDAGMTQSMSRVSRCIDNGPMEAFWGMMKSEMYYLKKFSSYDELEAAVIEYINYYNKHRYQKRLNNMAPLEYRQYLPNIAA